MMIQFFMAMNPPRTTHQTKCVNFKTKNFYEDDKLKAARKKLMANLLKHAPEETIKGPVRLITKWCFPRGRHSDGSWKTTKPDTDNLNKLLKDCMTECKFWEDDAQVCSEIIEKFWASIPGIFIYVEELNE